MFKSRSGRKTDNKKGKGVKSFSNMKKLNKSNQRALFQQKSLKRRNK